MLKHRFRALRISLLGLLFSCGFALLVARVFAGVTRPHQSGDEYKRWLLPCTLDSAYDGTSPASYRSLIFHASDGARLHADFWAQAVASPTIVICHGYRASRANMRSLAALEYALGYNVLTFDFRGHGDSEGIVTAGDVAGVRDLQAALAIASQQPETLPGKICVHAFSIGASVALLTLPHRDVFALIADSPYAYMDEVLRRVIGWRLFTSRFNKRHCLRKFASILPWSLVVVTNLVFRMHFGYALIHAIDKNFEYWSTLSQTRSASFSSTPVLLIHSMGDQLTPISHACHFVSKAQRCNISLEAYFVNSAVHCGAFQQYPQQYMTTLQHFLSYHLEHIRSQSSVA
nr:alpha/beta fold hydrolase [Ktedonobacteraceae bacterium]